MEIVLANAIRISNRYFEIHNCGRDDLPVFFKEQGFEVGAEIGVLRGGFSQKLCEAGLKIYAVDCWIHFPGVTATSQERLDKAFESAKVRLASYDCTIIKKTSMEAVEDFEDNSLDFVYIDASHLFRYIAEDIWEWSKKVRPGGVISGHDFIKTKNNKCHVVHIVDAFRTAFNANLFILGRKEKIEGEIRDDIRSWMMFKQWK